ncbi:MAG: amino acid ABC transporter substrate-binding protein [Rhodoplanes sp.]|uniref:amino acid ABC transporter substrate-binding protein n=1 Tax=Rhodoplanes sp. TaxID=1968906 RepID=UPI00181805A5|nr:amino acid ABC transporter substrate-binding protein [Rhodoplanes sp.]NVO17122.1 amino acid ABC transporter substrate-binding protein [Rhodoplanes sp.]
MAATRREFGTLVAAAGAAVAMPAVWRSAHGQGAPIRIGTTISKTGALSATKSTLTGLELWRDDVNKAGGLLGRPVELVTYDDQSAVAQIPSLFSKLVDIDKVDVLVSPYGAGLSAPLMPFIKQRDLFTIGMFALAGNDATRHDKFFHSAPWGPDSKINWARGFFDVAKQNGCSRIAVLSADVEFAKTAAGGAEQIAAEYGMTVVYKQSYPPATNDFSSILRNIKAQTPDAVFVCSYPPDSTALVRGLSEVGIGDSVKLFGGAMVGTQYASLLTSLGPALNGIVSFALYAPEPTMANTEMTAFLSRYEKVAAEQGLDPLGFYIPPFAYVAGQLIAAAVTGAGSLDKAAMAKVLHETEVKTIAGPARFNAIGDWTERRVLMVQFRDIKGKDVEQFRQPGRQVILDPPSLRSGELVAPLAKARSS